MPSSTSLDTIEFITTSTTGNASDFEISTASRYFLGAGSNSDEGSYW